MPAIGLPHGPGGRALDQFARIAQQLAITLLTRAKPSQRFYCRLANQCVIGQRRRGDLLSYLSRGRVPDLVQLLQQFYRVIRQTGDWRRVPSHAPAGLRKIRTQSENSHLRLAKRRPKILERLQWVHPAAEPLLPSKQILDSLLHLWIGHRRSRHL